MNKPVAILLTGIVACLGVGLAQARPPYPAIAGDHYSGNKAIVEKITGADKCNLCHDAAAKAKKARNEYGVALSKHMDAAAFKGAAGAGKAALDAALRAALNATEAEKHSSGKTFGEIIKDGKLPGEK